jgi:hypothetical protein
LASPTLGPPGGAAHRPGGRYGAAHRSESSNPRGWSWDIHDDALKTEGHVAGFCYPVHPQPIDAVDNCKGGGSFSRFFGDSVLDPAGPFDAVRTDTLLTDGKLDAGDAPMPAARVDIKIAPNINPLTDIGGAGALVKAGKTEVYRRQRHGLCAQPLRAVLRAARPRYRR